MIELTWIDKDDNALGVVTGQDENDASDAMLRLIKREERGLRDGDYFQSGRC